MARTRQVKVPTIIIQQAKKHQRIVLEQTGRNIPIWEAMIETEVKKRNERKQMFGGFRL